VKPAILFVVVAALAGCYTVNADLPGALRGDVKPEQTEKIGSFSVQKSNTFYLFGLVGAPGPDFFAAELRRQVDDKHADGVASLRIQSEWGCVDLIVSNVTLGCISPRTYTISGDVVRIKTPPIAGKKPKPSQSF
jgi:hypothetical protein